MSKRFVSEWASDSNVPLSRKLSETLHPVPLKDKISKTTYRLNTVQKRLEDSHLRMEQKYKTLFNKCVHAQEAKDPAAAIMYANECAQVKKMGQTILTTGLALEQVILRLDTVKDFGDVAAEIVPAAKIIQTLTGRLAGILPDVSMQLGQIGHTLDSLVLEVGQATGHTWNTISSGEDAEKILAEANAVAEQKVREGFPSLPTTESIAKGLNPP